MAHKPEPPGPKPPLVGLVKLEIHYTGPGTPTPIAANILHGRWTDNTNHTITGLNAVASAAVSGWMSATGPGQQISSSWSTAGFIVQSLGGDGLIATNPSATPGLTAQTPYPPNCAVCASWRSTATWRGGRPRTYIPGVPVTATTSIGMGNLSSTYSTNMAGQLATFLTHMNAVVDGGANFALGFPSYYTKYAFRVPPVFFPFTGVNVHDRIDSQRRRTGKERYFAIS